MPVAPFFPTPAGVQDYTDAQNYQKWSNFIRDSMNDTIKEEEKTVDVGNCQFYNPEIKPAGDDRATAKGLLTSFASYSPAPGGITEDNADLIN